MKKNTTPNTLTLKEFNSILPAMNDFEYGSLKADIKAHGQLLPILMKGKEVIDGRARLKICKELRIVPFVFDMGEASNDVMTAISSNLYRRHLTTAQRAFIAHRLATNRKGENQHTAKAGCSIKEAATLYSVSDDSLNRARKVDENGCEELKQMVLKGGVSLEDGVQLVRKFPEKADQKRILKAYKGATKPIMKQAMIDDIRAKASKLGENNQRAITQLSGTYSVIYADPPWDYGGSFNGSACDPTLRYPVMPLADIKALPVKECLTESAVCFMWVPNCLIPSGLELLDSWGFSFVNTMVWCKDNFVMSEGATKTAHETLLIGKKGQALHERDAKVMSWHHEKITTHSKKPEHFAKMIEAMYPEFPKLEMFAREAREGWSVFGNEVVEKKGGHPKTVSKKKLVASNDQEVCLAA